MNNTCLEIISLPPPFIRGESTDKINLSLTTGKRVALLGLNGAGKSSLVRLLVGESFSASGDIFYHLVSTLESEPTTKNPPQPLTPSSLIFKKILGYQADTMLAISNLNGYEFLQLAGASKNLKKETINQRIDDIDGWWPIKELLQQEMTALSKGNLQKLMISQVFLNQPKFLFFDEPCQSLDPLEQDRFNQILKNLSQFELCLFSTHNVEHALEVADEIVLFHQSRIAYHFKMLEQENIILVARNKITNIIEILQGFNCNFTQLSNQVFRIAHLPPKQLETIEAEFQIIGIDIEFCLTEKEAIIPLFRLLASGEINFDEVNSSK